MRTVYAYGVLDMMRRSQSVLGNVTQKFGLKASRSALHMVAGALFVAASAGQAHAQSCTPQPLFQAATSFEGRDASGSPAGFDADNLTVGDFVIFDDAVIADYNTNARIDLVLEVTGINLNSANPPVATTGSPLITLGTDGVLSLSGGQASRDPFITYRIVPFRSGTVTGAISTGEIIDLSDAIISLQDIDSSGTNANNSDVGGFANNNPGSPTLTENDVVQLPFQNGGGAAGFTTYTATPASTPPPSWQGAPAGGFTDNTLDLAYASFSGGEFLHGHTGATNGTGNRGAVPAACGSIRPAELSAEKMVDAVIANPDGTTTVTYTVLIENTGQQNLTGILLTDEIDSLFAAPYDAFTPSTDANTSGGIVAIDANAQILTDNGAPIGVFPTNPNFDGGSDVNVFDPANTTVLSPGDQIQVTLSILLNANTTGAPASFVNAVEISSTDEFFLPVDEPASAAPIEAADATPSLSLDKPAPVNADEDGSGDVTFGDTLTYTITATNDGAIDQTNVVVSDPLITPNTATCAGVPVGGTCVLTGTYSVTNADVSVGMIDNTASVQSDEVTTPVEATQSTPTEFTTAPPPPTIPTTEFVDFTSPTDGSVCSGAIPVVAFSGGTNGLSNLDDTFANGATVNGALTQVFVPEGAVDSVNVSGNSAGSITFSSPVVNPLINFYQLDDNDLTFNLAAGQSVVLLSSNDGQASTDPLNPTGICNVTLTGNTLRGCAMNPGDQNVGPNSARSPDAANGPGELEGAGTVQFIGTFTAIAFTSSGTTTSDNTTRMAVGIDASTCTATSLSLDKPAPTNADEDGSGNVSVGDTLTYTITATNTGLTTQNNVIVSDPLLDAPNSVTCPTLAAGATCVLTGTHVVTAAEANAGMVDNTASVQSDEVTTPVEASQTTSTVVNPIDALSETYPPVDGVAGGSLPTILGTDMLNGAPVDPADVDLTIDTVLGPDGNPTTAITVNADGTITVPAGTPAGDYTVTYTICEITNPTNCDTVTETVTVTSPVIDALPETYPPVSGADGGTLPSILGTDMFNGAPVDPANIDLTIDSVLGPDGNPTTAISVDPTTGEITVPAGTPAGDYTVTYTICDPVNPTNCDTVTETVTVDAPAIDAMDDDFTGTPLSGADGGTTPSVFGDDTLNGDPFDPTDVTVTLTDNGGVPGAVINPDGTIDIPAGTPAGTYTFTYEICEVLNPTNCDTATATVVVEAPAIAAEPEAYPPVNGADGGSLPSVLGSDMLNGAPVDPADVDLTIDSVLGPDGNPTTAITVNPDGTVTVPAGTPAGDYTVTYTICEITNPSNCATVTETVTVTAPAIAAEPEAYPPVDGATGATLPSLLGSDTLNGAPVDPADVDLTIDAVLGPDGNPTTDITVNPDGTITVPAGAPAGDYTVTYTICEVTNPTNCATVTETVSVLAAPSLSLVKPEPVNADEDGSGTVTVGDTLTYTVTATNTGNAPQTNVTVTDVQITPNTEICATVPAGGTCVLTGTHVVTAAEANAGVIDNTATVSSDEAQSPVDAMQSTPVELGTILAEDDNFAGTPLVSGEPGATPSVFGNDTLNGQPVDPAGLTLTLTDNGGLNGASFNPDGTINVPADTPAGTYVLQYEICEVANPTNCSIATVTIVVEAMPIDAVDDDFTAEPTPSGGTTPSLFGGDTLNSGSFTPDDVTLTLTGNGGLTGLTVNSDGTLNIPNGAPAGTFVIEYEICDVLNPTNCDIATATIVIEEPAQLFATKVANTSTATTGSVIAYTIAVRNDGGTTASNVDIVDTPPLGFRYIEGSALLNGVETDPEIVNGQLFWSGVDIAPGDTATVNLALVVGSGVSDGDFVNIAFSETGPGSVLLSNQAQAIVRITPDELFDCSEVIGKVFEDVDGDGYQDQGEPGLPGVRVATVNGLLITTDEYGRYHIACAATPKEGRGSNFIVKLDTRSLPSGLEVTTENPRVVRLTQGKLTSADFGVRRLRAITIDMLPEAFVGGSTELKDEYASAMGDLLVTLQEEPTVLTLTYEGVDGEARMEVLTKDIKEAWGDGPYKLEVRTKIISEQNRGGQ